MRAGVACRTACVASGPASINARAMALLDQPLATMEFVALDTETNGLSGASCELTEVGAVLVGGGELHDRWSSLVHTNLPLGRGIQRFTGITQADIDGAPEPEVALGELARWLEGRVLVAHNAPFDTRVLKQAFERCGLDWPEPPALCTAQLARRLMPLQKGRKLAVLADALGIEVDGVHRALLDAETCARIFCALFTKLCGAAATVGDAVALCRADARRSGSARRAPARVQHAVGARELPQLEFGELPSDPGVYIFRDAQGEPLYVGKSVSIARRARAHFAPATQRAAWTQHAAVVDYRATASELGALVTENRLIKELAPPGNVRLATGRRQRGGDLVYIRCRLDIAYPILEVADAPAAGLAVNIGPLRGREWVGELVEQLESLHQLRHCGRRLARREHPSAYGQMGRCLSPCLGDLDPNLYRRRLDQALARSWGRPTRRWVCWPRSTRGCARPRRPGSTSGPPGCAVGGLGVARFSPTSRAACTPLTSDRPWCSLRTRPSRVLTPCGWPPGGSWTSVNCRVTWRSSVRGPRGCWRGPAGPRRASTSHRVRSTS